MFGFLNICTSVYRKLQLVQIKQKGKKVMLSLWMTSCCDVRTATRKYSTPEVEKWKVKLRMSPNQTQPTSDLGRLGVEVSTHITRHTHPRGLLWTSDKLVAEATTYTTRETETSVLSGIRNRNPSNRSAADLILERTATGIITQPFNWENTSGCW